MFRWCVVDAHPTHSPIPIPPTTPPTQPPTSRAGKSCWCVLPRHPTYTPCTPPPPHRRHHLARTHTHSWKTNRLYRRTGKPTLVRSCAFFPANTKEKKGNSRWCAAAPSCRQAGTSCAGAPSRTQAARGPRSAARAPCSCVGGCMWVWLVGIFVVWRADFGGVAPIQPHRHPTVVWGMCG